MLKSIKMTLQLNKPIIDYKAFPEDGTAPNTEQMPKLIAEEREPLSVRGLMKRRLNVLNSATKLKNNWWNNWFDTGDGIAYHPSGKAKIVLNALPLRDLNQNNRLSDGALIMEDGLYEQLQGLELSKSDLKKYARNEPLSVNKVLNNPIWIELTGKDIDLLKEYGNVTFNLAKENYNYDKNMRIYVSSSQNLPTMRLWCVNWLYSGSNANGRVHLGRGYGRLVGVRPRAEGAEKSIVRPSLEQVLSVTNKALAELYKKIQ